MLFVAEIGLNHDGNFDLACEMIRQAKLNGADIVKFQFGWRDKPGEINCIDLKIAEKLKACCKYFDIEMMASTISENGFNLAKELDLKRYKIASRTVVDKPELCERVIKEGKEVFVSLGFWDKKEFPFGAPHEKLRYIYCVSRYPTYPDDLKGLPEKFRPEGYYGYSDHCLNISACLLAITRGAQFIEKHFTLNKTSQVIRDHVLSATPEEFRQLTQQGGELAKLNKAVET